MPPQAMRSAALYLRSEHLLQRARQCIAGGDSSSMRVLPYHPPLMIASGLGCRIRDADENEYIDVNMAYGPLLFGHRPPFLTKAVIHQLEHSGSQLGFPHELNYLVGEKVKQLFPSIELMRFTNSGSEAVAASIRLARAVTGRPIVLLFEGHYHGWSDAVFHKYHAPPQPDSIGPFHAPLAADGVRNAPRDIYVVPWNDATALSAALEHFHDSVAAVLMEPVMGNAGVIPPKPDYLAKVRDLTRKHGALLIFDEVITGMRVAPGGAQQLYGVVPHVTILSKALGGGFPIAAFGASAQIMEPIANGSLFHGGVYAGNALVLAAANAVLTRILDERHTMYTALHDRAAELTTGIREILRRRQIRHVVQNVGPMIAMVLTKTDIDEISDFRDIHRNADFEAYIRLQRALLDQGTYVHPNQYEPMYLSAAHEKEDIGEVLTCLDEAIRLSFSN